MAPKRIVPHTYQRADRPSAQTPAYGLSRDGIKADLTTGENGEKPIWPLSCYGPGKDAPRQLIEGECEQSPEEVRLQYYLARASGNQADLQQYVSFYLHAQSPLSMLTPE